MLYPHSVGRTDFYKLGLDSPLIEYQYTFVVPGENALQ